MVGGAADLSESTKTEFPPGGHEVHFTRAKPDRNLFFGVREHGMGGTVNGMAAHGGIVRPYGSTFLQFADYMRGSIRLSALTGLEVAWVYTHDSVGLGEDGPTHQPVEHLAALRAIPSSSSSAPATRTRPRTRGPRSSRISTGRRCSSSRARTCRYRPTRRRTASPRAPTCCARPRPTSARSRRDRLRVWVAMAAPSSSEAEGIGTRVVSMPSWELFDAQDDEYREEILPPDLPSVSIEAGIAMGWSKYVDASVSIERFGASAPGEIVLEKLGITPDHAADKIRELLAVAA
jgi:transketolase